MGDVPESDNWELEEEEGSRGRVMLVRTTMQRFLLLLLPWGDAGDLKNSHQLGFLIPRADVAGVLEVVGAAFDIRCERTRRLRRGC